MLETGRSLSGSRSWSDPTSSWRGRQQLVELPVEVVFKWMLRGSVFLHETGIGNRSKLCRERLARLRCGWRNQSQ